MSAVPEAVKDAAYWTEAALETWARYMRMAESPDGIPDHVVILQGYTTSDIDSERAYQKLDTWIADTTHAVICGLVPAENAAIYRQYLQAVWRFPRGNYQEMLARARANVQAGIRRRGVWMGE